MPSQNTSANESSLDASSLAEFYQQGGSILLSFLGVGVVANFMAFIALIKVTRTEDIAMNVLSIALVITDLLGLATVSVPTLLCYTEGEWVGGIRLCNFQGVMGISCILASGCLSTAMASDRLTAIGKPFFYRENFTYKQTKVSIIYVWVLSLTISILPLVGLGGFKRNSSYCTVNHLDYAHSDFRCKCNTIPEGVLI